MEENGIEAAEREEQPADGSTMYPNPVEISVIPRNETFSESMSAMIA